MIMNLDLMLIRELLWTSSINLAYAKLVDLEAKCVSIFRAKLLSN